MNFGGSIVGVGNVQAMLKRIEPRTRLAVYRGLGRGVAHGQTIVRGNARGRPGPRAPTGDFNRTIVGEVEQGGDGTAWGQIGTNAAQALRLEFGFVGTDVLGRTYNQPPYPYMSRSVDAVAKAVTDAVFAEVDKES